MQVIAAIATAYLLGSIPFGYLIVRLSAGADVRESGSGGTGATNVSRRAGKFAGVLTLVLDLMKGAAAIAIARFTLSLPSSAVDGHVLGAELHVDVWTAVAGVAAITGHCFPVWLKFRGGKGVATGVGVFLLLAPWALAGAGLVFIFIVGLTRYVSLGSITAAAMLPVLILALHSFARPIHAFPVVLVAAVAGSTLIIFMHRANIRRLLNGSESKFK
jgi:acyl phosphate:glycerol-3-phosphate acyltransferase